MKYASAYTSPLPIQPFTLISSFTWSNHLLLGLPLFTPPLYFHSHRPILLSPDSFAFLILVTLHIRRSIHILATSNFFSCAFFSSHVSAPCICAGLATVQYTFTPIFAFIFPSLSPVRLLPLHSTGDFCIQFSTISSYIMILS